MVFVVVVAKVFHQMTDKILSKVDVVPNQKCDDKYKKT